MSTTEPQHEEHADGIVEDREKAPPVYFSILFFGLIIWGVIFMSFYLLSGWSSDAEFQEKMAAHKGEPVVQEKAAAPQPPKQAEPVTAAGSNLASRATDSSNTLDAAFRTVSRFSKSALIRASSF